MPNSYLHADFSTGGVFLYYLFSNIFLGHNFGSLAGEASKFNTLKCPTQLDTCCNNLYFSIRGACSKLSERNHDNIWLHKKKENNQDFTRKSCEIDIKRKYSWHESGNLKPAQRDEKETHTKLKDESCSIQIIKTNNIPSQKKETTWISWKRINLFNSDSELYQSYFSKRNI